MKDTRKGKAPRPEGGKSPRPKSLSEQAQSSANRWRALIKQAFMAGLTTGATQPMGIADPEACREQAWKEYKQVSGL